MLKVKNNYPSTSTSAYDMLRSFDLASPRRRHIERTGDKGNRENCGGHGGRDHKFSNKLHHRLQSSFQVSAAARHIASSVSIVKSGDIMIISAQNPCETERQTTQDKILHKSSGVSHKEVVAVQ